MYLTRQGKTQSQGFCTHVSLVTVEVYFWRTENHFSLILMFFPQQGKMSHTLCRQYTRFCSLCQQKCLSALQISTCPDSFNPIIYKISFDFFLHPALFQRVSSSPSGQCFKCNHTAAESKIIVKAWLKERGEYIDRDRRDLKRSSEQQLYTTHSVRELQFTVTSKEQWKERKKTLHLFTLSLSFPPTDAKTPNQTVCTTRLLFI